MKNIITISALMFLLSTATLFGQTRIYPPNLRAPVNGEQEQVPDVNLDWDAVTGETLNITYELQLATNSDFTDATIFEKTALTATQMEELLFGQTYYWRVKAFDDETPSDWSEVWSFKTASTVHFKTTPGPEIGEMVYANPEVSWDKLTGLSGYELQIDTTYGFAPDSSVTDVDINATFVSEIGDKWAVGADGAVLHFEGTQWIIVDAGTTENLNDVYFVSETEGYVVGDGGTVIYFDGTTWNVQDAGTTEDLNGISFIDANTGWAVGNGGVTIRYDAGAWAEETTDNTNDLYDVFAINSTNVWACGKSKTVSHFNGSEWLSETIGTKDYYAVWFMDENSGWVVGKSGKIFYFNGTEWLEQESGTSDDLFSLSMAGGVGYAVGESGTMLLYNGDWSVMASGYFEDLFGVFSAGSHTLYGGIEGFLASSTDGGFNSPYLITYDVPFDSGSYQLSNLLFGETFFYRIRAIHSQDVSEWSGPWSMSTYAAPELDKPSDGDSDTELSQLFKWFDYEGATEYLYQIGADENFSSPFNFSMDTNSVDVSVSYFGEDYFWHVRALHPDDISDWSETRSFTTVNTVTLESPEDNAEDVNSCPKFIWEGIEGVSEYEIAIDLDEDFTNPTTKIVEENFSQCQEAMEKNTIYYWKVRAVTGLDSSGWSATWSLKTEGYIGIDDNLTNHSIQIYPNPSNGEFSVTINSFSSEVYQLSVTDVIGKVLLEEDVACIPGENKIGVKLGNLEKGIYLVNIKNEEQMVTKKLFIR